MIKKYHLFQDQLQRTMLDIHLILDFTAPSDTPIYAAMGGTVIKVVMQYPNNFSSPNGSERAWGNYIQIVVWDGSIMTYAHQQQSDFVKVGDRVYAGQQIGLVGNTGYSTGNHLHINGINSDDILDYFFWE